jgi:mono/diheme cytochrome c family protein
LNDNGSQVTICFAGGQTNRGRIMIRAGLVALSVLAMAAGMARAETPAERGKYLVNTVMTCGNCHTPKGPTGDIMDKAFSGGLSWDEPPFTVTAPNITPDKDTGIGSWSDADIKKLMRTGIRPNGVEIAVVMPTGFYDIITEQDMDSIVAYLRTLKPISNKVPDPIYKMHVPRQIFPGAEQPYTEQMMLSDKLKKGFYLVTIAHCMECHTPLGKEGHNWSSDLAKGGRDFPGPWGTSVSRNITQSKSKGIGEWSDAEIKRAITQGISKDGSHLKPPMGYSYYAGVSQPDLDAMIAWLRTVPPKE